MTQHTLAGTRSRATRIGVWLAVIVAADQATKSWVVAALSDGPQQIVGSNIEFLLARNSGAAFSRFRGFTPVLAIGACVITVVLARTLRKTNDRATVIGLVMVLGGALGNLGDRVFRSPGVFRGEVVDFVKVGSFPLFNVADSCITVGAILIAIRSLRADHRENAKELGTETGHDNI